MKWQDDPVIRFTRATSKIIRKLLKKGERIRSWNERETTVPMPEDFRGPCG